MSFELTLIMYSLAMEKKMKRTFLVMLLVLSSVALFAQGGKEVSNISVISREDGSGTRGAFTEIVGLLDKNKIDQTTVNAEIANSTSVVITTVQGNKNAIGYISLGSLNDSVKAVKVNGVEATQENIVNGSYPLQRPFNIAYKELSDVAQDFISYIFSSQGQALIAKKGYVSVGEGKEYVSSNVKGKLSISGSSSVYPVMEVLTEAYKSLNPSVEITLQQSDSTTGMNDAKNGVSDIGMASRELKASEIEAGLNHQAIAIDGIAVIVNKANTVEDLTMDQIKEIYLGNTTSWEF